MEIYSILVPALLYKVLVNINDKHKAISLLLILTAGT